MSKNFVPWRTQLYNSLDSRRETVMELIDSLSSNRQASSFTTKKGRHLTATILGWKQMLMRGTKNYKMNRHPFTLLQITVRDEIGNAVWKPMGLIVIGSRRFGVESN